MNFNNANECPPLNHHLKQIIMNNENLETVVTKKVNTKTTNGFKPTPAFIGAAWASLGVGFMISQAQINKIGKIFRYPLHVLVLTIQSLNKV